MLIQGHKYSVSPQYTKYPPMRLYSYKEAIESWDRKSIGVLLVLCKANPKATQPYPKDTKADLIYKGVW